MKDDFIAKLNFIWCCYIENSFTRHLLNYYLSKIVLFTLHIFVSNAYLSAESHKLSKKKSFSYSRILLVTLYKSCFLCLQ